MLATQAWVPELDPQLTHQKPEAVECTGNHRSGKVKTGRSLGHTGSYHRCQHSWPQNTMHTAPRGWSLDYTHTSTPPTTHLYSSSPTQNRVQFTENSIWLVPLWLVSLVLFTWSLVCILFFFNHIYPFIQSIKKYLKMLSVIINFCQRKGHSRESVCHTSLTRV